MDIPLPKTISPCPIVDALFEMRFSVKTHPNAVFGLIFSALQKDFPKVENLPILQLPEAVRASDSNLRFKPHYRISNDSLVVQIGPDVLSISSFPKYIGWEDFSIKILEILEKTEKTNIINSVSRIGIRYINFFENNIYEKINLTVASGENKIVTKNTVIRTELEQVDFNSTLQIANNAKNNNKLGSIIDIDTFSSIGLEDFFSKKEEFIKKGHEIEKNLFFSLLKKDFLESLNPKY